VVVTFALGPRSVYRTIMRFPAGDPSAKVGTLAAQRGVFAWNEISIDAPPSVVWRRLVEAADWAQWCPSVQKVEFLVGGIRLLDQNTRFSFIILGRCIRATVDEFVPYSRLGWFGINADIDIYQSWLLRSMAGGCHVMTEAAANGPGALSIRDADPQAVHRSNELWMSALKRVSERKW
jgi:hypothetical protein